MKKFCNSQVELCDKTRITFEAGSEVIDQMPELTPQSLDDDILNMTYHGKPRTLQIVLRAKEMLQKKRENTPERQQQSPGLYGKKYHYFRLGLTVKTIRLVKL